jgi:uncharacterized protein (TIGR00725 family)
MTAFQVAVCGPADATGAERELAVEVGRLLAARGATVVCGGGGGVMAAVAAGARSANGLVVGVRPGPSRDGEVADADVTIVTNMGEARNAVIVWSADAVIVVGGSWGTLSEVALAMRRGDVPVVSVGGWRIVGADGREVPGIVHVDSATAAVDLVLPARGREDER